MPRLFLSPGHGLGNSKPGLMDPGASANGTTEHAEAVKVCDALAAEVQAAGIEVLKVPYEGLSLAQKAAWINARKQPGDILWTIHLDSASATARGATIFYDDKFPSTKPLAEKWLASYCAATGIPSRGAKTDTQAAVGSLLLLSAVGGEMVLWELCYIGNIAELTVVRQKAAHALAGIAIAQAGGSPQPTPPAFQPSPEQVAAFSFMVALEVFTSQTPKTQNRYEQAVLFSRLVAAADLRYVRS